MMAISWLVVEHKKMKGWKTLTAGLLSIGYGVVGYALGIHDASKMMEFVVAGLASIGIGHKLDKGLV